MEYKQIKSDLETIGARLDKLNNYLKSSNEDFDKYILDNTIIAFENLIDSNIDEEEEQRILNILNRLFNDFENKYKQKF